MARRRGYMNRTMYNYSTSGGPIQEDFGAIGEKFLEGTKYVNAVRRAEIEKIQKQQEEIIKLSEFPLTGNKDVDQMALRVSEGIRNDLMNARKRIGINGFSRADFNAVYTNAMSSSKTYSGLNEYMKNEIDRIDKDNSLSEVTKDLYMQSLGSVFNKDAVFDVRVENGSILIDEFKGNDENGNPITQQTSVKDFMMNGAQDIKKFDPLSEVETIQKLYMDRDTTFQYTMEDLRGNPALLQKHITKEGAKFDAFLNQYMDNFAKDDERVISFLYDEQGVQLGEGGLRHQDGRINLTEEQRDQAKESFRSYILGQMGIVEKGNMTFLPRITPGKPSPFMTISHGNNIIPSMNKDGYSDPFGLRDILGSRISGFVLKGDENASSLDTGFFEGSLDQRLARVAQMSFDEMEATNVLDDAFKISNADLFDNTGNLRPIIEAGTVPAYIPSPDPEDGIVENPYKQMSLDHITISNDASGNDLQGLSSSSGREFNTLNGIAITYTYKNEVQIRNGERIERVVPVVEGLRVIGNTILQESANVSGVKEGSTGFGTGAGQGTRQQSVVNRQAISNTLNDGQISSLLPVLYKSHPELQNIIANMQGAGMSLKEALALALQQLSI